MCYYKQSLKVGVDCRDSGLGWVLKKLKGVVGQDGNGSADKETGNGNNNNSHK